MVDLRKKVEQGVEGKEVMRLLFREEFGDLAEDGFEGSKEEYQIFEEVFYRTSGEDAKTGKDTHTKPSATINHGDSVLRSSTSMKDSSGKAYEGAKMNFKETSAFESFQESSSCVGSSAHNALVLLAKLSPTEHLGQEKKDPVCINCPDTCASADLACLYPSNVVLDAPMKDPTYEPVSSTMKLDRENGGLEHNYPDNSTDPLLLKTSKFVTDMPVEPDQEAVPCRVIETSERGILSTHNLSNHQGDMDAAERADDALGLNYNCRVQQEEDVKVVVEGKSVTSPVSQESVASVLLASAHLAPKETSSAVICAEQNAEEHKNLDTVDAAVKLKNSQKRELSDRLEFYAHRLLKDAGWKIEPRQRNDRSRLAYFFINNKEGLVFKALTGAWKACGERLLSSALDSEQDENGREWWDVDSFWRDMTDTMAYIDHHESSVSLLHRWKLLDPFMAIVWIDKKLSTLQAGKGLKAVKSTTFILDASWETISGEMAVNGANKNAGEVSSCLARSLNQSILPAHQNPEVIDLQNENGLVGAERKCCCSEVFYKNGNKGLAMHTGKGLGPLSVKCQHMGSTHLGSRRKRSNRLSSKSKFMQRDKQFSNPGPNENKNLCCVEEASSLGAHDNCGHINNESEMQCPGDQTSQHEGNIVSSTGSNLICNSVYQDFSSLPREGSSIAGELMGSETTKSKRKRTAATPADGSAKKARKKSKKISEIGAIEVIGKEMKTQLHDSDRTEELVPSMVDKTNEQLNLVCHLKDTNNLLSEPSLECLQQVELVKKQMSGAHQTSRFEDMNVPTNVKVHKKRVKSEIKAARQSGKVQGDLTIPQEDEQGNALLKQDVEHHKSTKGECKAKRLTSINSNSMSLKKHKVEPEFSMVHGQLLDPEVAILADNGTVPKEAVCEDIFDEVPSTSSGVCPERESDQKPVKSKKSEVNKKNGQKIFQQCRINDDDLLIAAILKKKDIGSSGKQFSPKGPSQLKALRKLQNQKGSCKLLPRALRKGGNHSVEGGRITLETRTVLCWLIEMGALSVKDVVQYRNPKDNTVVKDGWVTREGILCKCCTRIFSISEFKAHAGLKQQRRPSLNLFIHSGKPYTLCQLEAWAAEFKKRKSNLRLIGADEKDANDDTCGLCGEGGDLICCDNCPSTYHQTCLSVQELPEGNWYCPNCICVTCRDLVNGKETSSSSAMLECAQCEHKYHSACIVRKCNGETGSNDWFCGENCQEVYFGLRSRVGVVNYIDDGFSWTILRCSHDDQKVCSAQKVALKAECNSKLAIGLNLMEECFLPMVDPRTGINMIPHVLYNLGSPFARLNYQGFYAVVLEKGDQLISIASIRVHGATVAEMPLIATCSEHRRQGMCRRLLNAIEKMLISFKVKVLVLSAIPSLVETWTSGFGFKLLGDEEKKQLTNVNLMLFPGTTLLTKSLHEASSAQESVENVDVCSREQLSHIRRDLMETASTLSGHQPTENSKSDLDANSFLPIISNTQVEKVSIQERKTLMTSTENCVSTDQHDEHGVVSNAECCLNITTSNINGMDQDFSTDQVVACQKPVANISVIVHSCSNLFASKDTNIELPSSPSCTTRDVIIRDMEESIPQNISIPTEDNAAEAMNGEREIPSEGDEVAKEILVDGLQVKNDAILSDEQAKKGPSATTHEEVPNSLSSNKTNVATIRNMEENTSRNAYILNEMSTADTMNNKTEVSISGGVVERKSPVDASLGNTGACISDELAVGNTNLAALNSNVVNFEG